MAYSSQCSASCIPGIVWPRAISAVPSTPHLILRTVKTSFKYVYFYRIFRVFAQEEGRRSGRRTARMPNSFEKGTGPAPSSSTA